MAKRQRYKPLEKQFIHHFRICLPADLANHVREQSGDVAMPASMWLRQLVARDFRRVQLSNAAEADAARNEGPY